MAWPTDAQHTTFSSGVTRIGTSFLGAVQSGVTGVVGGTMPVTRLTVTGNHYLSGAPGGLAASGAIKAVGNVASVSGEVQGVAVRAVNAASGFVLGASGAVLNYSTANSFQTTNGTIQDAVTIAIASGHGAYVEASAVASDGTLGTRAITHKMGMSCTASGGGLSTFSGGAYDIIAARVTSGVGGGMVLTTTGNSILVRLTGTAGLTMNWSVKTDVTVVP